MLCFICCHKLNTYLYTGKDPTTPLTMLSSSDDCKIYTESNSWPSNGSHHTSPIEHIKSASITLYRNPSLYNVVYLKAPYSALSSIIVKHNLLYHSYADDTQIYLQCDNNDDAIKEAIHRLEKCIADVCSWMKNNSLKINEDKTEFIIFHKNKELTTRYTLQIGDNSIPLSTSTKILGVSLDSTRCTRGDASSFFCTYKTYLYA